MLNFKVRTAPKVGKAAIYGTDWCGYTTQQKQAFDAAGIAYDDVNCEDPKNQALCQGLHAFPVVKGYPKPGDRWGGFKAVK